MRAGIAMAILLLACGCERATPGEYFLGRGSEARVTSACPHGSADVGRSRWRFDRSRPGLKGNGFPRRDILAALHRNGGVLIEYTGRTFHSPYLHQTGNWQGEDELVSAEASLVAIGSFGSVVDRDTVYVEMPIWKRGRRFDGNFFPWSVPHDDSSPCAQVNS